MSNSGDNGSWDYQRNDIHGQQPEQGQDQTTPAEGGQDPYGQQQAQDPFGQQTPQDGAPQQGQDPWAQPPGAQDPYAQPAAPSAQSAPSASDPYGQPSPGFGPSSGPSASDPYGQPGPGYGQQAPGYGPAGGPALAASGDVGQSRLLVGLLGIFLGAFGVHRFLMGYTTIGIIQVCITVLSCGTLSWISGIWGLVEGIMVLAKSEQFQRDAHGRPLTD